MLPCTDLVQGIVLFCCLFQGQWEDENSCNKRMGRYQIDVMINGELIMNLIHVDFILDVLLTEVQMIKRVKLKIDHH